MTYTITPIDNHGNCEVYLDGNPDPVARCAARPSSTIGYVTLVSSLFPTLRVPISWVDALEGMVE